MKKISTLSFLIILINFSCSKDTVAEDDFINSPDTTGLYFPPISSDDWETMTITDLGWNTEAEKSLYDFLEENDTKSFIILKNGKIAVEQYFNGSDIDDSNPWFSVGKTLTAFTIGIAQQEGLLDINSSSSTYLGNGWAAITSEQENAITVKHHLTMTTGLDYSVSNNCTDPDCLTFLNPPEDFWYYHTAAYTLLTEMVANAANLEYATYFDTRLKNKIGMSGNWVSLGYANVYYSNARSMARFGLLNLNKGNWNTTEILTDQNYFTEMTTTSQSLNQSYGYLWWLNGKSSSRIPGSTGEFSGSLIPDAPDDMIAGLGLNDQKLYIVPSQNLVVVRMGNSAGQDVLGPSSFDNELWIKINALIQ
ncbi:serine hydrolase [Aquimarina addita]|uniref:Serine hydrolase n=1 Tax=Aquimarina addita TaxID=870485 RepID=A0ABP6UP31_9FLAO